MKETANYGNTKLELMPLLPTLRVCENADCANIQIVLIMYNSLNGKRLKRNNNSILKGMFGLMLQLRPIDSG